MKFEIPFLITAIISVCLAIPINKHKPETKPVPHVEVQQRAMIPQIVPKVKTVEPIKLTGCAAYLPYIQQYDWDTHIAQAIMQAENSSCEPAKNNAGLNYDGSVDYGLFQVNSIHADMVDGNLANLTDPATNVRVAYQIYTGAGWRAWSTYLNGAYLKYL